LLIADPARRTELGEAAAARADLEFTVDVMTSRYEALYLSSSLKRQPTALRA